MPLILFLLIFISPPLQAQKQKLDASYDIGSELILLQTMVQYWYDEKDAPDNLFNFDEETGQEYDRAPVGYHAIYRNPKDNSYYYAHGDGTNLYVTNSLTYKLDMSKQETNYTTRETEYIYYVGSLSPLERLYIDIKNTNIQYIKRLVKITNDPFPVYPRAPHTPIPDNSEYVYYTNNQGRRFSRHPGNYRVILTTNKIDPKALLQEF